MPIKEIFKREADGSCTLIETREVEAPPVDLQIQQKEALLMEIWEEIQALKTKQDN